MKGPGTDRRGIEGTRALRCIVDAAAGAVLGGVASSLAPLIAFAALLLPAPARAQNGVTVTAQAVPPTVVVGDVLRYRVLIESPGGAEPSNPVMPSFDPFVNQGTSTGTSISITPQGQKVSRNVDVVLRATRTGTFQIAPASVQAGGKRIESNPVRVIVTRQEVESAAGAAEGTAAGLEGFISARTGDAGVDKQIRGRLFLYTEIQKSEAVPCEPIVARTYVYKATGLVQGEQYGFVDEAPPTGADYLRLESYRNTPRQWEGIQVGGVTFQRALVEEVALIPTKTGTIEYQAMKMGVALPVRGARSRDPFFDDPFGDPFASFFGRNRLTAELPAPVREITVRPLPQPQPKGFSGIVGDFSPQAAVDRDDVKEGEIVTYTLTFSGKGYADAIPEPSLPALEGFTLYDKKAEASNNPTGAGVEGVKTFEYLLKASKRGMQTIPAQEFVVFDPAAGRYVNRASEPVKVNVRPSDQQGMIELVRAGQSTAAGSDIRQLAIDIEHIHTGDWDPTPGMAVALYKRPGWWALHGVPLLILVGALAARRRRDYYFRNPEARRRGRAVTEADRRLRKARRHLISAESDRFYGEVAAAIRGFLGDKLSREPSGLTNEEIVRLLAERNVSEDVRQHTVRLLDACDAARYSLGADAPASRHSTYDEAALVLRRLREALA